MGPEEFINFNDKKPDKYRWIIVTNNLSAKNSFGEMSHVWMTNFYTKGSTEWEGLVMFDGGNGKIVRLTHWKYA